MLFVMRTDLLLLPKINQIKTSKRLPIRLPGFGKSTESIEFKGVGDRQFNPATPTKRIQSRKWLDFLFL